MESPQVPQPPPDPPPSQAPLPLEFSQQITDAFQQVLEQLYNDFGNSDLVHDAAASAVRTVVRRYRDGLLTPDHKADSPLVDVLFQFALKRYRTLRDHHHHRHLPLLHDPAAPTTQEDQAQLLETEFWTAFQKVLLQELRSLKQTMAPYIQSPLHRAVFSQLFNNAYRNQGLTQQQIADACHCSISTVQRVQHKFDLIWLPLVEAARTELLKRRNRSIA